MGYSGVIQINGTSIFEERKENNSQYCLDYAIEYSKSKDCLLTKKAINETIECLNGRFGSYHEYVEGIRCVMEIISKLSNLLQSRIYSNFDDKGKFILVVKNEEDMSGFASINFYECDKYVVMEKDKYGHYSKEQQDTIKRNRKYFVDNYLFYCVFHALDNQHYDRCKEEELKAQILDIKTRDDIISLIEKLHGFQTKINKKYLNSFEQAMIMSNALIDFLNQVENGCEIFVSHENNTLIFKNKTTLENIEYKWSHFFTISNLFQENNVSTGHGYAKITTKEELGILINKFPNIKKRSSMVEKLLNQIYEQQIANPFSLLIEGGY